MLTRKIIVFLSACLSFSQAKAQLTNSGQIVSVSKDQLLFVDGDYEHKGGSVFNNGLLNITGNWRNDDSRSFVFSIASTGVVEFSGSAQEIGGAFKTVFPGVRLSGTEVKSLSNDIEVFGNLELNDREFSLGEHTLSILNSEVHAVSRTSGFISTASKGKLSRVTNSSGTYLFPLGFRAANSEGVTYRPLTIDIKDGVDLKPFAAALVSDDPSASNFDRTKKRRDIQDIFDKYYYLLSHDSFNKVDVRFYQNSGQDLNFKQLVGWSSEYSLWEKAAPSTVEDKPFSDFLDRSILLSATVPFRNAPFSFASLSTTNPSTTPDPLTIFNAFSPDGDGKNDTWVIKNLDNYPNNNLLIYNRWGDEVFKSKGYSTSKAWDGSSLNSGTYYYVLNVELNGQMKTYKGFITMIKKD